MSEELKACPFCGNDYIVFLSALLTGHDRLVCNKCGCNLLQDMYENRLGLEKRWNTRADAEGKEEG